MAQFEVPQFIDTESKIVGPLTIKQFIFIAVPALIVFFLFFVLNTYMWVIVTVILMSLGASLAFIKVNKMPFYKIMIAGVKYFWEPKLFLWRRPIIKEVIEVDDIERKRNALQIASSGVSSVAKLWQNIMTKKEPIPKREKNVPKKLTPEAKEQYQVFKRITGEKEIARRVDYR